EEENLAPVPIEGTTELDPFPQSQPFAFEAVRPALAARGLAEAENELAAFVRAGQRVIVTFPHRGEALRTQNLLRRVDARLLDDDRRRRNARLPLPRLPRRGPPLRPTRAARQGLALRRRGREGAAALEARRQGVAAAQVSRARIGAGARRRPDRALREATG